VRSGVENEAESWGPIQDWLLKHRWEGRTIILIHHEGKGGKPRGSSKREDVLDTMIGLRKKDDQCTQDESVFELTFSKARDFFGDDAEPMLIKLKVSNGQVSWAHETVQPARSSRIRSSRALGMTAGRVSQLMKEVIQGENVVPFRKSGAGASQRDRERDQKDA